MPDPTGDIVAAVIALGLLIAAAFLTMAELAIAHTTRVKAHHLAAGGRRGGEAMETIAADPARYTSTVVFLRVLCQAAAVLLVAEMLGSLSSRPWALPAAAVVLAAVIYVCTETVPRMVTLQHSDFAALVTARPVQVLTFLLAPVTKLLLLTGNAAMGLLPGRAMSKGPFIAAEELRELSEPNEDEAGMEEERELIDSIFEFGDTVVREVMVPRPDMVTIPADASPEAAVETALQAGYSRIPIYEGDSDNIVGVLYIKDLMKRLHESNAVARVRSLGRAPLFVPEQKKVAELLREMQRQHVHMAIVVDEYGGTAGLVTIEDLIEEIVGEIVDEYDREEPLVEPLTDHAIRVDAKMAIEEVNELLGAELPHDEWDTVGGLVFDLTGRVPVPGEKVQYDSIEFRTERVSGRRIQKVVITKLPGEPETAPE